MGSEEEIPVKLRVTMLLGETAATEDFRFIEDEGTIGGTLVIGVDALLPEGESVDMAYENPQED